MQKQEEKVKINCILTGQTAERFTAIKRAKGIWNKTEVIRTIINEYFSEHFRTKEGSDAD
jgi:hypothetical protein